MWPFKRNVANEKQPEPDKRILSLAFELLRLRHRVKTLTETVTALTAQVEELRAQVASMRLHNEGDGK